jgi:hypothetical protein
MAGKGKRPEGGVDWGKQYERSPFLSPWEKRLEKESDISEVTHIVYESYEDWAKRKVSNENTSDRSSD